MSDYHDVTYRHVPALIEKANGGDYLAAERLIELLWVAAKDNPEALRLLIDYFGERIDALRKAGKARDVLAALNLVKPAHAPPGPYLEMRNELLAASVESYRKTGLTCEDAIAAVAVDAKVEELWSGDEEPTKKEETVRAAYKRYGKKFRKRAQRNDEASAEAQQILDEAEQALRDSLTKK